MLAVIGLGNPGGRYAATRHNAGFMALDRLVGQLGKQWAFESTLFSELAFVTLSSRQVVLAKPQTYMNQSGRAVLPLTRKYAISPEELLVVFDDFSLDFGRQRFRRSGSDGGHKGLASIIEVLDTQAIARLRLGIGQPSPGCPAIDYVLSPFARDQQAAMLIERSVQAIECWVEAGIEAAMNRFNSC